MEFNSTWTLWYDYKHSKTNPKDDWKQQLKKVCSISDAGTLQSLFDQIEPADTWPTASNIHFFRDGIDPAWEDPKTATVAKSY